MCVSRWPPPEGIDASSKEALDRISDVGVRLVGLGRQGKGDVWVWRRLAALLRREQIQVLHAHKFGSNFWASLLGRPCGVPVVLTHEHSWSYEGQALRRYIDRHVIARSVDRIIAVSKADQRRMVEVERIPESRTLFVPNGIPSVVPASDRDLRGELASQQTRRSSEPWARCCP